MNSVSKVKGAVNGKGNEMSLDQRKQTLHRHNQCLSFKGLVIPNWNMSWPSYIIPSGKDRSEPPKCSQMLFDVRKEKKNKNTLIGKKVGEKRHKSMLQNN